ncbi:nucleosomal histone kinase 1 [Pieris rapae]|uniref:nucleosomal histone kinase 1 n=1 Tax=Pieris rapae TaxID=64459 RepID=UPI001E27B1EF|nr:nucleosomal histone kinase 1 [Pieris rapae]XP_022121780.2 nucleosomal histone kinase 1 [Pieris rapae]
MPRRWMDVNDELIAIKKKKVEECLSLDTSFCDDQALTPGIVFTDISQRQWRLGQPIGRGSFGRIYLASNDIETEVTKANARYIVKIEPHSNGPLFVEVHCLIRTGETGKVKLWRQQHRLKNLGMPQFVASGSFTDNSTDTKYRFLVLPRYDIDLQKIISKTKILDLKNVLIISIQVLDVLEYLHSQGYTHSDIKSSNLMIGFDGNKLKLQDKPSFQKHTTPPKPSKKVKSTKSRSSNYYDDEDFTLDSENYSTEKKLANVRRKITQILTNKDRSILRHHAFNLRQLTNVNYEDINSLCSDRSYQKDVKPQDDVTNYKDLHQIYKEAIQSQSNGQVYLLDYGLASKFLDSDGNHKDFCMDARKAHDGTLEYSSRDSHIGAHSRRSDLETLGFNILDWLTGILPWKSSDILTKPDLVHALKKNFMSNVKLLLKTCFKTEFYPQFIEKYLQYIVTLEFTEKPDYEYCRSLFKTELVKIGHAFDKECLINFNDGPKSPINKIFYAKQLAKKSTSRDFIVRNGVKKSSQRENIVMSMDAIKFDFTKHLNISSDGQRKPCSSRNFFTSDADLAARLKNSLMPHLLGKKLSPKNLRSKKSNIKRKGLKRHRNSIGKFGNFMGSDRQFTWAEILAKNPEDIIRKERNIQTEEFDDDSTCKYRIRKLSSSSDNSDYQSPLLQKDYLERLNPTYAMREVVANLKKRVAAKNKGTEENTLKANSKVKCSNMEILIETAVESPLAKPCTRSTLKRTDTKNNSTKSSPTKDTPGTSKSKDINNKTKSTKPIEIKEKLDDSDNSTKNLPRITRANKTLEQEVKVEEKNIVVRKLPTRKCKVKEIAVHEKKTINNNPTKIPFNGRKSVVVVLKKMDIKEIPARKSPKTATNRRKLRSHTRKKILPIS